ncbi:hypothetical protein [Nonlabens ponticola]|uniref:Outer membrane protein beta-barrel domain-containing protein n=1 Tax=Nonlabens ponticola TaxID=2496866 RepID=A0A3S9MYA7_9FLAO|nr:hypothetical protein [Nonlabens ponticola]AZQ44246.1 hypothetical protein EJ995_08355 [Nonlabens ponticola]
MRYLILLLVLPCLLCAQQSNDSIPVHLREVPRYNLMVETGVALPIGDYGNIALSGLSIAGSYDYYFNKRFAFTAAVKHLYNETAFENSGTGIPKNETLYALTAGVLGSKTYNRFQIDVYGRTGIGFLDTRRGTFLNGNNEIFYTNENQSITSVSTIFDAGVRFNYYFRRSVQVFFSPQYVTTIGSPLEYNILGPAVSSQPQVARELVEYNLSNFIVSFGVKFSLGKRYSNGELRKDDF